MIYQGRRMAEWRAMRGLTQSALAQQLQIGRAQVTNLEIGNSEPSLQTLVDIACVLGVTTDYLLGITDDPGITNTRYAGKFDPLPFDHFD